MSEFLGRGFAFPIRVNGRGVLSWSDGGQSISEAIWLILSTPLKSRMMRPEFGCGIHDYLFAPNTPRTRAAIIQQVQRALVRWEPRIDVVDVTVDVDPEAPYTLMIRVDYRVRSNNALHNIVYPFYLTEGAV